MAALIACDPERLRPDDPRALSRGHFDLVFNLGAIEAQDSARLAARLIAEGGRPGPLPPPSTKPISEPLANAETALLSAVAPLTDGGPSALKRLYNVYRLARVSDAPRPLVAVMVAALQGTRADYAGAIHSALMSSGDRFEAPAEPPELAEAFAAASGASETHFDKAAARAALAAARLWTA